MNIFIPQRAFKLMLFLPLLLTSVSCEGDSASHIKKYKTMTLTLQGGETAKIYVAESVAEQKRGLSKIEPGDLSDNEGMLFPSDGLRPRQFWMPEVYFDLDLFFLSKEFYVLDIHRSLKSHKSRFPESEVPRSKTVMSVHVLELKSGSPLAAKIKQGMILDLKKD